MAQLLAGRRTSSAGGSMMTALALQLVGLALSILGWLGSILACALPMWKVTAFIGSNIIVAQVFWEGLWMNCVYESTGQMQCKVYDSLLDLPADLQTARALVVVSIAMSFLALLIAICGARCTRFVEDPRTKAKVLMTAGVVFILAGMALLFPVSWSARNIVSNFYNPLVPEALKRELGISLYIGWAASAFLIFGGGTFCCFFPPKVGNTFYPMRYWTGRRPSASSYARKDYV
ncbi:claudin-4-like isoform X2 [Notechis scutatus]|uniref:Claudin n=1 Tax=Notechis scutatus TaxID=8663 RepID=A0A6J1UG45_9SAUR|nr:claudin-4-like isoform X2 [Notechis scutatus]